MAPLTAKHALSHRAVPPAREEHIHIEPKELSTFS
jgi:hypothetical protein